MKKYFTASVLSLLSAIGVFAAVQPSTDVFGLQCPGRVSAIALGVECENSDTLGLGEISGPVYGLSVDMTVERTSDVYLVRIVMEDEVGRRYLVAEDYPMLGSAAVSSYDGYCEETAVLWKVVPKSLRIHAYGARVIITGLKIATSIDRPLNSSGKVSERQRELAMRQAQAKCAAISESISRQGKLWFAGVTSLSAMPFEERMRMVGFSETGLTNGIEFYSGGIFDIVSARKQEKAGRMAAQSTDTLCVPEFDWRNRHGKDWLTPVKDQGQSGYCAAFSAVSCLEAVTNLYYNRKFDLDLSEQEAAVCCGAPNPWYGINPIYPLYYMIMHGICDEAAYPFVNDYNASLNCLSGEVTPNETVFFDSYIYISDKTEERVKKALIKYGPLHSGYEVDDYTDTIPQKSHGMALYGYKVIEAGDTIHWLETYGNIGSHGMNPPIVVDSNNILVGRTAWKFKNSYINGGLGNPPYMFITFDELSHMTNTYALNTPISTMNYSDLDIVCEDSDGDGYYYWGIGPKPSTCPSWVPEDADGDDSNPVLGPMDKYGHMSEVHPSDSVTLYLTGSVPSSANDTILQNAVISSGTSFRLQGTLRFLHGATLTVEPGGYFLIDGGSLITAKLILMPGSTIVFDNYGEYIPPYNTYFEVPEGALLQLIRGTVHKHYQQE